MKSKTISELVHQLNESSIFVHFSLEKIEDKNYANVGYFFSDMERTLHCEAGVTQEDMANQTGLTVETVSNIERGVYGTKFEVLEQFAEGLGVEVKALFEFGE